MTVDTPPVVTTATLSFLRAGSWPQGQRPYELLYIPSDGMPLVNFERVEVENIPIHDVRARKGKLSLDKEGFIVVDMKSSLKYEDFLNEQLLKTVLAEELRAHLLQVLGARALFIHECVTRKRTGLPAYKGDGRGVPIPLAHTDYTLSYIQKLIGQLAGDENAEQIRQMHYQMLNVWLPLRGPCRDWPLALCDIRSVADDEIIPMDEVHPDDVLESQQMIYSPSQKWCYLSDQQPHELLIFKAGDSRVHGAAPHGAFLDPRYPDEEHKRESMEFRVLVVY